MLNPKESIDFLIKEYNVVEFVGVPCSYLKSLINEAINRDMYKSFFNEGDAVAYAVGRQIADPTCRVCILMQNSGIGNAVNPITSLSEIYKVPLLMVIGDRQPVADEPQHSIMGEISKEMLQLTMMETGGVAVELVHCEESTSMMPLPSEYLDGSICYFVRDKNVFEPVELDEAHQYKDNSSELNYEKVISAMTELRNRGREFILVTTTGYTSRVALTQDDPHNFYNFGAMGCAWSVANGLVKNKQNLPVICLDGDGSYFMRASAAHTFTSPSRCVRVILKNGTYRSTGAQNLGVNNEEGLCTDQELAALVNLLDKWIQSNEPWDDGSPVEILINNSVPKELPRPDKSIHELKWRLTETMNPGIEIPEEEKYVDYSMDDVFDANGDLLN